jgi:pSer/pThr/pTyr-binding forkhead associated (FHA) protein
MQPRHRLVITSNGSTPAGSAGAGRERSVPLTAPVTVIGRSATADLRLDDPGVSRRHAEVQLQGDVVRVVDVGSTNGTSVNGEQVGAKQLASGDRIQVGSTVLVYRSAD